MWDSVEDLGLDFLAVQEHKLEKRGTLEMGIRTKEGYEWWRPARCRVGWIFRQGVIIEGLEDISEERVAWVKWHQEGQQDVFLASVWPSWSWNGKQGREEGERWWDRLSRQ